MATNTVPAMPSVSNMSAGLIAPGEGPILSKADIGARSRYNAQLHVSAVAGSLVSDPELGEAVCVVHRAASLLNGTAGEGVGGKVDLLTADVAEVKSKLASVEADMAVVKSEMGVVKSDMAVVKSDMAEVKSKLVSVEAMLAGIRAGQENVPHRNANGMSRMPDHPLEPLQAEVGAKVGEYPPADLFPASLSQIWALHNAALNNLEQFYGRSFTGPSMAARQSKFASFIGVYA